MDMTISKESDVEQVTQFVKSLDLPQGTEAEQVGDWVWLKFPEKPSAEIRATLKAAGFRWIEKRGKWAHCGGCPVYRSAHYDPREKYGASKIVQDQE